MVTDKEFRNRVRVNHVIQQDWDKAAEEVLSIINKVISRIDESFVVIVKTTDDAGRILFSEVYVSDKYVSVGNLIASYEYKTKTSVDVYAVLGNEYCIIKSKLYDSSCYESYAGCTVSTYDYRFVARSMWDWNTTIFY